MAKTRTPLLSIEASGTLGKSVIYSRWKKIRYARVYAKPGGPPSPAQLAQRAAMADALAYAHAQFADPYTQNAWRQSQRAHAPMLTPWAWCIKVFLDALATQP